MPAVEYFHEVDPKQALLDKVGDISGVEIFGSDVLVALYTPPEKTKSGIIMADDTRNEFKFQGKAGLVIKLGNTAYIDDEGNKFRDINVGDWVGFRPSDGWPFQLNTRKTRISKDGIVDCRIVTDINIRLRVSHPDEIH
jgi:co-chaperonin GroES (HSP10)